MALDNVHPLDNAWGWGDSWKKGRKISQGWACQKPFPLVLRKNSGFKYMEKSPCSGLVGFCDKNRYNQDHSMISWYHPYPGGQTLKDRFKSYMWSLCVFWDAQQQNPPDKPSVPPSQNAWQRTRTTFTCIPPVGLNHPQPPPKPLQHDAMLAPPSQVQWPRATRTFELGFEHWIQNLLEVLGFQSTELSPLGLGY